MAFARAKSGAIRRQLTAWILAPALFALASGSAHAAPAGPGHSHGGEAALAAVVSSASPRIGMMGELYDVVAVLKNGQLTFYVDRTSDTSPVTDATVEVSFDGATAIAAPTKEGTYQLSAEAIPHGAVELIVSVQAPDGDDLLAGTLVVPDPSHDASHPHVGWLSISPSNLVAALAGALFVAFIGLVGAASRRRRSVASLLILAAACGLLVTPANAGPGGDGHTHGEETAAVTASNAPHRLPDGSVFVPKPTQRLIELRTIKAAEKEVQKSVVFPGRVIASPNRSGIVQSINGGRIIAPEKGLPQLGQTVEKNQLLALVEPPMNAADETTISDKAGEIAQQIALSEAKLQRLSQLAATNAVPKTQLFDLETELASLRKRLVNIRTQRREEEELRAPVDGTVASSGVVAGQVVAPQDQLFQIVDAQSLWVEGFIFGQANPGAIVKAEAITGSQASLPLRLEGISRALQRQAVQIHFSIAGPSTSLRIGETVRIVAQTREKVTGIVLPREAIVRASNGETIVWTLVAPERFEPKPVRIEPLDGDRVVITGGLAPEQRVVVAGAELVNQIR